MTSVTGSSAPESMTPEEPELRRANGSGLPQIILDLVGESGGSPVYNIGLMCGGGQRFPLCGRGEEKKSLRLRLHGASFCIKVWSST